MFLTKSTRAIVALIAIFSLLACQAAWASHVSSWYFAAVDEAAGAVIGCHGPGDTDIPENVGSSPCESAQAPSDAFKVPPAVLAALTDATLCTAHESRAPLEISTGIPAVAGAPPPLHLLHCRFLK